MEINTRIISLNYINIEVSLDRTTVNLGLHDLDQAHLILAELKDSVENLQECVIQLERQAQ